MNDKLDAGVAKSGQSFSGVVAEPVVVNGRTGITSGTQVAGTINETVSSGRLKKAASVTLELNPVDGRAMTTATVRIDGKSHLLGEDEGVVMGTAAVTRTTTGTRPRLWRVSVKSADCAECAMADFFASDQGARQQYCN
jgi:hypothetical protein